MFVSVAYVGTTGHNLLRFTTPNFGSNYISGVLGFTLAPPFGGNCSNLSNPCIPIANGATFDPGSTFRRPVANVGAINQFETTGRSRYDSLQIGWRGRLLTDKVQY